IFSSILAGDGTAQFRRNSLLSVYIDVRRQRDWGDYDAELAALLAHIRSAPPAAGSEGVRIPGERNPDRLAQVERDGITAEPRLVTTLRKAAEAAGRPDALDRRWPEVF